MSTATGPTLVPRKRRGAELMLILMALVLGVGAFVSVALGVEGAIPERLIVLCSIFVLLALVTHAFVRRFAPYADPVLLPLVLVLNGVGLAMIYRIDLAQGATRADRQFMWTVLGIAAFIGVLLFVRDHRILQGKTYTIGLAALVLLILPMLPGIGQEINGARIWIRVGGFSFQPGELAKIMLAIAFAGYLVRHRDALALAGRRILGIDLPRGRDLGPIAVVWAVSLGILVLQRDLGSSLLFFGLFVVMLYIATERPGWLFVGIALFVTGAYAAYTLFGHVRSRIDGWLDPFAEDRGQLAVGLMGQAFGGLVGRGWGNGEPYLTPEAHTDFIMASLGEELGLTGVMALLMIYALLVERGLRIALTCRDGFGKLLAAGLAISLALQVFIVVGGVTNLIPLTGLTTPFMAQGGSSLLANWMLAALLLRISDQTRRPPPEVATFDRDEPTQVVKTV